MAITEAQEVKAAAPSLHLHLHPYHWSSCTPTLRCPQVASQTSGLTTPGCVVSGSGEMPRVSSAAKAPIELTVCVLCVTSAANAPVRLAVCMIFVCWLRKKSTITSLFFSLTFSFTYGQIVQKGTLLRTYS